MNSTQSLKESLVGCYDDTTIEKIIAIIDSKDYDDYDGTLYAILTIDGSVEFIDSTGSGYDWYDTGNHYLSEIADSKLAEWVDQIVAPTILPEERILVQIPHQRRATADIRRLENMPSEEDLADLHNWRLFETPLDALEWARNYLNYNSGHQRVQAYCAVIDLIQNICD